MFVKTCYHLIRGLSAWYGLLSYQGLKFIQLLQRVFFESFHPKQGDKFTKTQGFTEYERKMRIVY